MGRKLLTVTTGLFIAAAAFGARPAPGLPQGRLRDGFVLMGIEGRVTGPDSNDTWLFELAVDVNDEGSIVKAGTSLELLPSATLEKLAAEVNAPAFERTGYRLWGRVTKYKGRNYIFPVYFFAVVKVTEPQAPKVKEPNEIAGQEFAPDANAPSKESVPEQVSGPNDVLEIPQEIIERLKTREIIRPAKPRQIPAEVNDVKQGSAVPQTQQVTPVSEERPEFRQDSILADRTASLTKQGGRFVFVLDALGRNAPQASLHLLPCEILELTERRQSAEPDAVPFKIAGITTKYKGRDYLLLQKATRVYNYGNFGR